MQPLASTVKTAVGCTAITVHWWYRVHRSRDETVDQRICKLCALGLFLAWYACSFTALAFAEQLRSNFCSSMQLGSEGRPFFSSVNTSHAELHCCLSIFCSRQTLIWNTTCFQTSWIFKFYIQLYLKMYLTASKGNLQLFRQATNSVGVNLSS